MIRAVIFDVGECLVDETTEYGTWADWLQVPRHTFAAMFGAVIAQGRDYREVFQEFRPGFDLYAERECRAAAQGKQKRGTVTTHTGFDDYMSIGRPRMSGSGDISVIVRASKQSGISVWELKKLTQNLISQPAY